MRLTRESLQYFSRKSVCNRSLTLTCSLSWTITHTGRDEVRVYNRAARIAQPDVKILHFYCPQRMRVCPHPHYSTETCFLRTARHTNATLSKSLLQHLRQAGRTTATKIRGGADDQRRTTTRTWTVGQNTLAMWALQARAQRADREAERLRIQRVSR